MPPQGNSRLSRFTVRALHAIDYTLPVASAQVKSCVLLGGLYADGETVVREPVATRDHTEIALSEFGADITMEPRVARVRGGAQLSGKTLVVPGDFPLPLSSSWPH